jgi:hypothetical protein
LASATVINAVETSGAARHVDAHALERIEFLAYRGALAIGARPVARLPKLGKLADIAQRVIDGRDNFGRRHEFARRHEQRAGRQVQLAPLLRVTHQRRVALVPHRGDDLRHVGNARRVGRGVARQ